MVGRPISLRWLVPAISAAILAIVVTAFGTIAYRSVRRSALDRAAERLTTVAEVFGQLQQQPAPWVRAAQATARNPDIVEVVRSSGQRVSDSARSQIARLTPDTGQTLATDVRSPNGTILFAMRSRVADSLAGRNTQDRTVPRDASNAEVSLRAAASPARLQRSYPDSGMTSELYRDGSQVLYERAEPIRYGPRVIGHLVLVRKVAASTEALRRLSNLIGREAVLVVGNRDGSLWTNLQQGIVHPPASTAPQRYVRDGRRWMTASIPAPTAPWVIGVEFPEDIVLAPVHALRWRLFLIGTAIVVLAVLVTERLSRRLTVPLQNLTRAAEDLAAGHRAPITALQSSDEIGRLSRAFASMAHSIRTSHDTLETQIGERTQELQAALTRLRQAQSDLVRQERLATLGHLSGSIAHELRNPLGVMTNALYYLEAVLADAPPKVREHLTKLRVQVRLSASIITGLLDFTRSGPPQIASVDVEQLVDEQLSRLSPPLAITIVRDIAPNVPPLRVDPVQVGQILMNLFTNALQAMEGMDGVLTIRAWTSGERVRIEVADTGPGVRAEDHERIFEPLFTTKARGIGLGLSVSRSLARANGGDLTLVPQAKAGAVFAVELPATADSAVPQHHTSVESPTSTIV